MLRDCAAPGGETARQHRRVDRRQRQVRIDAAHFALQQVEAELPLLHAAAMAARVPRRGHRLLHRGAQILRAQSRRMCVSGERNHQPTRLRAQVIAARCAADRGQSCSLPRRAAAAGGPPHACSANAWRGARSHGTTASDNTSQACGTTGSRARRANAAPAATSASSRSSAVTARPFHCCDRARAR